MADPDDSGVDVDAYAPALAALAVGFGQPWRADANCRGKDTDLFFPDRGVAPIEALVICGECPVWFECLSWAVDAGEDDGVLGRMRAAQRERYGRLLAAAGVDVGSDDAEAIAEAEIIVQVPDAWVEPLRGPGPRLADHAWFNEVEQGELF